MRAENRLKHISSTAVSKITQRGARSAVLTAHGAARFDRFRDGSGARKGGPIARPSLEERETPPIFLTFRDLLGEHTCDRQPETLGWSAQSAI